MEFLTWPSLDQYLIKGIQGQFPISSSSNISFLIGPDNGSLALRLPTKHDVEIPPSPYSEIEISKGVVDGTPVIELTLADPALVETFYNLSIEIAQQMLLHSAEPEFAISRSMSNWAKLIRRKDILEDARQVGLMGELCLLKALITSYGLKAADSWIGPLGEPHDFRLNSVEIEVKSTTQTARNHKIHGIAQLEPSKGMALFLLSLQFGPAGTAKSGRSLVNHVNEIKALLATDEKALQKFVDLLASVGYRDEHVPFYSRKLKLRSTPMLVPVNNAFPRISRELLNDHLPLGVGQRVSYVEYEVNLDGLGNAEGTAEFSSVLPDVLQIGG